LPLHLIVRSITSTVMRREASRAELPVAAARSFMDAGSFTSARIGIGFR
jgi:hypothetical protein